MVKGLLERMVRLHPDDPRPRFYLALVRDFGGETVAEREFLLAVEGFRREGEPFGRVYSLTALAANRCFVQLHCDATAEDFLTEAELTAEELAATTCAAWCNSFGCAPPFSKTMSRAPSAQPQDSTRFPSRTRPG